jgi:hypothetical protein
MGCRHARTNKHPAFGMDFEPFFSRPEYYAGCPSLKSLREWFRGYLSAMHRAGYVIKVFESNEVLHGVSGKQVAFVRQSAKLVKVIPIYRERKNACLSCGAY